LNLTFFNGLRTRNWFNGVNRYLFEAFLELTTSSVNDFKIDLYSVFLYPLKNFTTRNRYSVNCLHRYR
jgi:hypothetical protein